MESLIPSSRPGRRREVVVISSRKRVTVTDYSGAYIGCTYTNHTGRSTAFTFQHKYLLVKRPTFNERGKQDVLSY